MLNSQTQRIFGVSSPAILTSILVPIPTGIFVISVGIVSILTGEDNLQYMILEISTFNQ